MTAFAFAYAVSVQLGLHSRLPGSSIAQVWPAAAVSFCWVVWSWRSRGQLRASVVALSVVAVAMNVAVGGMDPWFAVVDGLANVVQAVVACWVLAAWQRRQGTAAWRLRQPTDLTGIVLAALAGSAVAAVIGPFATQVHADHADWSALAPGMGAWLVRDATSLFTLGAVALRLADREHRPRLRGRVYLLEITVSIAVVSAAYGFVFGTTAHHPIAFLLVPLSLWIALRFDTTVAAGHVVLVGVYAISATQAGRGPFALEGPVSRLLLTQAYIAVASLVSLMLALHRDERQALLERATAAQQRATAAQQGADDQATLLRTVLDTMHEGVALVDANHTFLVRNRATKAMFNTGVGDGRTVADPEQYGLFTADGLPCPPDRMAHVRALAGEHVDDDMLLRRGPGQQIVLAVTAIPLTASTGPQALLVFADATAERAVTAALEDSEQRFRLAFATAPMGMMMVSMVVGGEGAVLRVNPAMCRLLGYDEVDLLGMGVLDFSHPDDVEMSRASMQRHSAGSEDKAHLEKRYLHCDGSTLWVRVSTSVVRPQDGDAYAIVIVEDITARRSAEEALTRQALHDPLTLLANRALFHDRLDHALAAAVRTGTRVGLLFLDLDGFKAVNDSAGHSAGDHLLQQVAARLNDCVRPGDTVARLGGDEFAVVCPGIDTGDDAGVAAMHKLEVVAERVLQVLRAPVEVAAGTFTVTASIGVSLAGAGTSAEQALQAADAAMYGAKRAGKNRIMRHERQQNTRDERTAHLLPELRNALADGEMVMYGQPVLDLDSGRVVAVETLIRWQHPSRGLLSPTHFLDVAEASPLMVAVGRRVLDESCRLAASWGRHLGASAPDVHVNVSGRQLEAGNLHDDVMAALRRHDLSPRCLVLELTETHMPMITHSLRADLMRLRALGIRIAIDDLGTGYSSLARLIELPVDILKIDLSFVAGLGVDRGCDAVVRAVLGIGLAMGLTVVAEGVETPEQADRLRSYGCQTAQGYLFSPPRSEADLITQLGPPSVGLPAA